MSTVKERLQHIPDELPDDVSFEDAVYEMYLQAKISRGLAMSQQGGPSARTRSSAGSV